MDGAAQLHDLEAELCASAGVVYLRLPITDHLIPDDATLQRFIALAHQLERQGAWVHFHCKAGRGRTTTFMALREMLRTRPEALDATRVLERQRDLGGVDLLKTKPVERDGGSSLARRDFLLGWVGTANAKGRGGGLANRHACA